MPTVSVILPACDAEATIRQTVRSVQRQTFTDFELLVVDDGSRDGPLAELAKIEDARLRILSQPNQGVSAARNRGIEQARGEFFSFIDADDLWTRDKLELQLRALRADPAAGAAYSWTVFIDEDGSFLFPKERQSFSGCVHADLAEADFLASASNVLARRECVETTGAFEQRFQPAEDWEFWLRASSRWPFAVVPRYQVLYRLRFDSHSADPARMHRAMYAVLEEVLDGAPELRARERAAFANIEQYVAFLYLARTRLPRARRSAGRHLARLLRGNLSGIVTPKVRHFLVLWIVSHFVPARRVPDLTRGLLELYGRLARLVRSDLDDVLDDAFSECIEIDDARALGVVFPRLHRADG